MKNNPTFNFEISRIEEEAKVDPMIGRFRMESSEKVNLVERISNLNFIGH